MQALGVISVNICQMIISLCNLLLLFWMLRKFFFHPIQEILHKRREEIEADYEAAAQAKQSAAAAQAEYSGKLSGIQEEAERIRERTRKEAAEESRRLVAAAKEKAAALIFQADEEIRRSGRKAADELQKEAISLSLELTEKLLQRSMTQKDQRNLIAQFLDELGEDHD